MRCPLTSIRGRLKERGEKRMQNLYTVHLSEDSEYHTQRNNMIIPMTSCNTTSAIMFLKASGIPFDSPRDQQPEDYLTEMLRSDEAYKVMKELAPWAVGNYPPNEVHVMLEWGINKLVGLEVDVFSVNHSVSMMLYLLLRGAASIASGRFAGFNHIVCVEGFSTMQDVRNVHHADQIVMDAVENIWIDDPYGDPLTEYKSHRGNNIKLTRLQFNEAINESGNIDHKWLHLATHFGLTQVRPKPIKITQF